jgi:hypothetical protein
LRISSGKTMGWKISYGKRQLVVRLIGEMWRGGKTEELSA